MDVLTAILACSLYGDDALVRAIAQSNSRGNPYAVTDATLAAESEAQRPEPRSLDAAIDLVAAVSSLGGEPLVGFMQIPASWATVYGKSTRDLFDPCINVAIGSAKLSDLDYQCARARRAGIQRKSIAPTFVAWAESRRPCVLRRYAQAIRMPEFEVVVRLELEHQGRSRAFVSGLSDCPILLETTSSATNALESHRLFFQAVTIDSILVNPFATSATTLLPPGPPK